MVYNLINIKTIKNIIITMFIILTLFVLFKNNNIKYINIKFNSTDSVMNNFYPIIKIK